MKKIAIFYKTESEDWIKSYTNSLEDQWQFYYFSYTNLTHLAAIFSENSIFFDGILCSGQIPYFHLKRNHPQFKKPMRYIAISEEDFYKKCFHYSQQDPHFQLKKCFIDFLYQENNFLSIRDTFPKENWPHIFNESITAFDEEKIYGHLAEYSEQLSKQPHIRYYLTRLPHLSTNMPDSITTIVFTPSEASVKNTIDLLIKDMEIDRLTQNQLVVGYVQLHDLHRDLDYRKITLYKLLLDFGRTENLPFILQQESFAIKILISYTDFLTLTHNKTSCAIQQMLSDTIDFHVSIGWGIGVSIQEALFNGEKAAFLGENSKKTTTYIIEKNGTMIGPITNDATLKLSEPTIEKLNTIYQKTNISTTILHRIYQALQKRGNYETNATDLALDLNTTERSANRYLKKLLEKGYASLSTTQQVKMQGRPKHVYEIHFFDA